VKDCLVDKLGLSRRHVASRRLRVLPGEVSMLSSRAREWTKRPTSEPANTFLDSTDLDDATWIVHEVAAQKKSRDLTVRLRGPTVRWFVQGRREGYGAQERR
jgi:hypothetical protein